MPRTFAAMTSSQGSPPRETLVLDGCSLSWGDLELVLSGKPLHVELSDVARQHMQTVRDAALTSLDTNPELRVYGWNQALGPLKDRPLSVEEQSAFQINVLRSHHAGVGRILPEKVARLALIIRANTLARGTAGVRPELVERIIDVVNAGLYPQMPDTGSMGTGDLQPMAAAGLFLIGDAQAYALCEHCGKHEAPVACKKNGLAPTFTLEAGEAIALISGSAVLSAALAEAVFRIEQQTQTFIGGFSLFCEATRAEKHAFDVRMHNERHIPAEITAAESIMALIGDSRWSTVEGRYRAGETVPRVQDATSVRSVPHHLAAILQQLEQAKTELERDINASTCNPIILPDQQGNYEFLSGGNWDGTVLGHAAHSLNVCITRLAVLTKDLAGRLTYEGWSYGLPPSLAGGQLGLNSGMTLLHTTGAALIPEMQVRANPLGTLSFPIKGGQEDHNTMAMAAVHNLMSNVRRADILLSILLLMSAQGIYLLHRLMDGLALGTGSGKVYAALRKSVAPLEEDRALAGDLDTVTELVREGVIADAVTDAVEAGQATRAGMYFI